MNQADLVEAIARHYGGDRGDAAEALRAVLDEISYAIAAGRPVAIAGFGTFDLTTRPGRVVHNPATGERKRVKGVAVPSFRPGAELKAYAAGVKKPPKSAREPVVARRTANTIARQLLADDAQLQLRRHLAAFDPADPHSYLFAAAPGSPEARDLAARAAAVPAVSWPQGSAPSSTRPTGRMASTAPLPRADVLVVCHTEFEAVALAAVFTAAWPWPHWRRYRHGWPALKQLLAGDAPALALGQAGRWAQTAVGPTSVLLVHSDIHLADGDGTPLRQLWQRMLTQAQPRLVLGVGAGGAAGPDFRIGDVAVSRHLRWQESIISSTARLAGHRLRSAQRLLTPLADSGPQILTDTLRHPLTSTSWPHLLVDPDTDREPAANGRKVPAGVVDHNDAALVLACQHRADPWPWFTVRGIGYQLAAAAAGVAGRRRAAAEIERHGFQAAFNAAVACWGLLNTAN